MFLIYVVSLELACSLRKPKFAGSISVGVDRFSGCENRWHVCHMIMGQVKDPLSINLVLVLTEVFSKQRELELKLIQASKFGSEVSPLDGTIIKWLLHLGTCSGKGLVANMQSIRKKSFMPYTYNTEYI
ncbi:hypothetical protein TNCV_697991 [Trichonephila clavipes]|nr:hypothetical protein TNCV_697991 [Trichonephila clavipes]